MKIKLLVITITSILSANAASADEYQWFNSADYFSIDKQDIYALSSLYYFTPQENTGPLAEFDYIQAYSLLSTQYVNTEFTDSYSLNGDLFIGNLLIGAGYSEVDVNTNNFSVLDDTFTTTSLKVGYLLSENLLVNFVRTDPEHGKIVNSFSARYNHQLNGSDYIGFNLNHEDGNDSTSLTSKYFTSLGDDTYLAVKFGYLTSDSTSDIFTVGGSYYLSKTTSISVGGDTENDYRIGFEHFFTKNIAFSVAYFDSSDNNKEQWKLGFKINL